MEYQPELGQMCFGQPWQQKECPVKVQNALDALQSAWYAARGNENPFSNTGARFDGEKFKAHAYSWNDNGEQEFNFAWRDVRVSWYKYLGRGTTINREMTDDEVSEMLRECMGELLSNVQVQGRAEASEACCSASPGNAGMNECEQAIYIAKQTGSRFVNIAGVIFEVYRAEYIPDAGERAWFAEPINVYCQTLGTRNDVRSTSG